MTVQIIGTKKCRGTQRVIRYFKERNISFQFVDLTVKTPGPRELELYSQAVGGADKLIDTSSKAFRTRNLAFLDYDLIEELLEHPELLKIPLVRSDAGISLDPDSGELQRHLPK